MFPVPAQFAQMQPMSLFGKGGDPAVLLQPKQNALRCRQALFKCGSSTGETT